MRIRAGARSRILSVGGRVGPVLLAAAQLVLHRLADEHRQLTLPPRHRLNARDRLRR